MVQEINQVVLDSIKKVNPLLHLISYDNNILSYKEENFDLKNFNLYTLFESYQLKLDLKDISADTFFDIIKLNAITFFSNETGEY